MTRAHARDAALAVVLARTLPRARSGTGAISAFADPSNAICPRVATRRSVATLSPTYPALSKAHKVNSPSRFSDFFFGGRHDKERTSPRTREEEMGGRIKSQRKEIEASPEINSFKRAVQEGDVRALHTAYPQLQFYLEEVNGSGKSRSALLSLLKDDIRSAVRMLLSPRRAGKRRSSDDVDDAYSQDGQGSHATLEDARLALRMFEDMPRLLGHTYNPLDCHYAVRAMAAQVPYQKWSRSNARSMSRAGTSKEEDGDNDEVQPREVLHYLVELRRRFPVFLTRSADWDLVLNTFRRRRDAYGARLTWRLLLRNGVAPEPRTRDLYMSTLLDARQVDRAVTLARDSHLFNQLKDQRDESLAFFLSGISRIGDGARSPEAAQVADEARRRLLLDDDEKLGSPSNRLNLWHALLTYEALTAGTDAAIEVARNAVTEGRSLRPTAKTFALFLQMPGILSSVETEVDVVALFDRLSSVLGGMKADKAAYSMAISALLGQPPLQLDTSGMPKEASLTPTPGQIREADELYQRALREITGPPDSALVSPLLLAYTSSYLPSLRRALQLYDDVPDPDLGLYNALLSACARTHDMDLARALLIRRSGEGGRAGQGVRRRPFEQLDAKARLNQLVLLLRASQSYEEAFSIYESALRVGSSHTDNDGSVDVFNGPAGWLVLLNTFSKLQLSTASNPRRQPPAHMVMSIVSDMRQAGVELDVKAYTTLLDYFGKAATSLLLHKGSVHYLARDGGDDHEFDGETVASDPRGSEETAASTTWSKSDELASLRRSITAIHSILQRSTWIQPDMPLVTALMDAYNRVGLFDHGLDIWNRLVLARAAIAQSTLAVLMDLCGRASAGARNGTERAKYESVGRRAWKTGKAMVAEGAKPNKGACDAYVEFLCRVGRLDEAVDVVIGDMSPLAIQDQVEMTVKADAKTIGMLLRFATEAKSVSRHNIGPWHRIREFVQGKGKDRNTSEEDRLWWSQIWDSVKRIGA